MFRRLRSHSCHLGFRVSPRVVQLEDRCVPTTFVWTNKNGGFWDEKTNWEPQFVPNASDVALVNAISDQFHSGTIIVRDNRSISAVQDLEFGVLNITTFSGATLSVTNDCSAVLSNVQGTITVAGKQTVGVILAGGTLSVGQLTGGSLNTAPNSGTSTFAGTFNGPAGSVANSVSVGSGSTLSLSSATVNLVDTKDAFIVGGNMSGTGAVNCSGTVRVVGSVGASVTTNFTGTTIEIPTTSAGSINGPGNWTNCTFKVENFLPNFPAGSFKIGGQSMSGTMTGVFAPGADPILPFNTGININNGLTVPVAGLTLSFPSGMLRWTAGSLTGPGALTNVGAIGITGALGARTCNLLFSNQGVIEQKGDITAASGMTFNNEVSGVFDVQADVGFVLANGSFSNMGLLTRSAGSGTSLFETSFNNKGGTIEVHTGTLKWGFLGANTGGKFIAAGGALLDLGGNSYTGTYTGSGPGTVRINSGLTVGSGGATFNFPAGLLQWTGGSLTGATLVNGGFMTVAEGAGNRTAGVTFNNVGTLVQQADFNLGGGSFFNNQAGATFDIQADVGIPIANGTVTNSGLFRKSAGMGLSYFGNGFSNTGGIIEVQSGTLRWINLGANTGGHFIAGLGATLDLGNNTYIGTYTGAGAGIIRINSGMSVGGSGATLNMSDGLLQWTGGTISGATLTNAASIAIVGGNNPALVASINNDGMVIQSTNLATGAANFLNRTSGIWELRGDVGMPIANGTFVNSGLLKKTVGTGTAVFANLFSNIGGTIDVQTGTLDLPGTVNLGGGVLQGGGILDAPVTNSNGFVRPGNSPGQLTINGSYTQSGTGSFRAELNGTTPGTLHDQIIVNGAVTLGGTLQATIGYPANVGDSFVILANDGSDTITGSFASLGEGQSLVVNGTTVTITYKGGTDNNDVVLTVTNTTPAVPAKVANVIINGNNPQRSRVLGVDVVFDSIVNLPGNSADAFQLVRQSDGLVVGLNANVQNTSVTTVSLTFTGLNTEFGSLKDGRYTLTGFESQINHNGGAFDGDNDSNAGGNFVLASAAASIPPDPYVPPTNIFRIYGDATGDGLVNAADLFLLRLAFGANNPTFDFDGNGVGGSDLFQFRLRFGTAI